MVLFVAGRGAEHIVHGMVNIHRLMFLGIFNSGEDRLAELAGFFFLLRRARDLVVHFFVIVATDSGTVEVREIIIFRKRLMLKFSSER